MSKPSSSVRTLLPLFAAALFVGSITSFAYYQNNDRDASDDASFSLPNPPEFAKYSGTMLDQLLVGAFPAQTPLLTTTIAHYTPVFSVSITPWAISFPSTGRSPPASLS